MTAIAALLRYLGETALYITCYVRIAITQYRGSGCVSMMLGVIHRATRLSEPVTIVLCCLI